MYTLFFTKTKPRPPAGNSTNVEISVEDFPPADYSLTITVSDVNGQTASDVLDNLRLSGLFVMCSHLTVFNCAYL